MSNVKIILLSGIPGVGKTTIINQIRKSLGATNKFKYKLVKGLMDGSKQNYVIGVYDGSAFEGSDKLSMAVQPCFIEFVNLLKKKEGRFVIYLEGDRLGNASMIEQCKSEVDLYVIESDKADELHRKRGIDQSAKFRKAKRTKVDNLKDKFSPVILYNNKTDDPKKISKQLISVGKEFVER